MPRKKAAFSPVIKRGPGRPPGSQNAGSAAAAVASLRRLHGELTVQKQRVDTQLAAVENAIRAMGGAAAAAPRGPLPGGARGPRKGSLKSYIIRVLTGKPDMAVKDITAAVRSAGYPTKNKTLAKSVGNALTDMPNVVKVGRGRFRLG